MTETCSRREFNRAVFVGLAAAALPTAVTAQTRRLRIGCTSLVWGALPQAPENLEAALEDMYALGYHQAETFAAVIEDWDKKGTLGDLLTKYPIPLVSACATVQLTDPSKRKENLEQLIRWGRILKKYGGKFMVMTPNGLGVNRQGYDFQQHKTNIVAALNEYATAMNDLGVGAGLHQHTNTAVATIDETYAVMEAVNSHVCKFAPDVGQLQKTGADAAKVVRDFLTITVHVHLKDWIGGDHMAGYCPLGRGKVDVKSILDMLETANQEVNVMHELDGSPNMPYTPFDTAQISKTYLEKLGYIFRST